MCLIEKINKISLIWIDLIVILISSILHTIFGFIRDLPDFNTYELFNLSPFFDFSLWEYCYSRNVFHTWGGWKTKEYSPSSESEEWVFYDETNITIINGKAFCYKYISYIDLLNNGQIIKNGTDCPKEYNKNCGRIDTLNQELCIEEYKKCPLYDIGIGLPPDPENYNYYNDSNIYYNNEKYNDTNKTIIGRLILNEGQPCYQSNEKLWRQFSLMEKDDNHLECTNITVFDKNTDDRYIQRGNITYKKIYQENLNSRSQRIVFNGSIGYETVNLYKREFLGIDKKCDEKFNLTDNFKALKKVQNTDKIVQIIEGLLIVSCSPAFIIREIISCALKERTVNPKVYFAFFWVYLVAIGGFSIAHIRAYIKMFEYDYSNYNCSDYITNEVIKKGNENNRKVMIYGTIGFYIDAIILAGNILVFIFGLSWELIEKCVKKCKPNQYQDVHINNEEEEKPYYAEYPSAD